VFAIIIRVSPSSDVVLFVDATTARDARVLDIVARADAMAAAAYASSSSAGGGSGGGGSTAAGGPGRIILSEFDDVASFPEHMQRYHASSKRWALLHKHFQVSISTFKLLSKYRCHRLTPLCVYFVALSLRRCVRGTGSSCWWTCETPPSRETPSPPPPP
jgi:hypothetical protein